MDQSPDQDSPYQLTLSRRSRQKLSFEGNDENVLVDGQRDCIKRSEQLANTPVFVNNFKRRKHEAFGEYSNALKPAVNDANVMAPRNEAVDASIMDAVLKADSQPDLIGDCTRTHALPLIKGKHQDLKSIGPDTVAALIQGSFQDLITSFSVVDCRYPYEFEGGHIAGALNIYTQEGILEHFFEKSLAHRMSESENMMEQKRHVIIFHCEFSSQRGPNLYRFLRGKDRELNHASYPRLNHPEMYILNGGYKAFYEAFTSLCEPKSYLPMDADKEACRRFRTKSKSWHCETKFSSRSCLKF
jgi:M-phase inducer phosphatase